MAEIAMTVVFCCPCASVPTKCEKARCHLYPDIKSIGRCSRASAFAKFPDKCDSGNVAKYLAKKRGRFGYVLALDADYNVVAIYDALKGKDITSIYKEKGTKCL